MKRHEIKIVFTTKSEISDDSIAKMKKDLANHVIRDKEIRKTNYTELQIKTKFNQKTGYEPINGNE